MNLSPVIFSNYKIGEISMKLDWDKISDNIPVNLSINYIHHHVHIKRIQNSPIPFLIGTIIVEMFITGKIDKDTVAEIKVSVIGTLKTYRMNESWFRKHCNTTGIINLIQIIRTVVSMITSVSGYSILIPLVDLSNEMKSISRGEYNERNR